jgi:hypothetical protein
VSVAVWCENDVLPAMKSGMLISESCIWLGKESVPLASTNGYCTSCLFFHVCKDGVFSPFSASHAVACAEAVAILV